MKVHIVKMWLNLRFCWKVENIKIFPNHIFWISYAHNFSIMYHTWFYGIFIRDLADSITPSVGRSVGPSVNFFPDSNFSALGPDRDLGFSRGPPPGTLPMIFCVDTPPPKKKKKPRGGEGGGKLKFSKLSQTQVWYTVGKLEFWDFWKHVIQYVFDF